jgi:hypothetical protein
MAVFLILALPRTARAQEGFVAVVDRVWIRNDSLLVDFSMEGLLSDRIRDGISRGLPMTMSYEVSLWRERSRWWDALESRSVTAYKIQRNVWDDRYFVDDEEGRRVWLSDLEALGRHLSRRRGEMVAELRDIEPDAQYYAVVSPSLRPLTIEDIEEVEAWLTGEISEGREEGAWSVITSMPSFFFGLFVDLAGLGDKSTLAESGRFRLDAALFPTGPERSGSPRRRRRGGRGTPPRGPAHRPRSGRPR